jgi:hypothetical protein
MPPSKLRNHFLHNVKNGEYIYNIQNRPQKYELVNELRNDSNLLKYYKLTLDNIISGKKLEKSLYDNKNLDYIKIVAGEKNKRERLMNLIEFCMSYSDINIIQHSIYEYSEENELFWWHQNNPKHVELTCALPALNAKNIIWLPLEGLKNQININFEYELIIYEEDGLSRKTIKEYINKIPGCVRIVHRSIKENEGFFPPSYTLLEKWINMSKIADSNSRIYATVPADDYSPSIRLSSQYKLINEQYDFCPRAFGFFYHIKQKKYAKYNASLIKYKGFNYHGLDYTVKIEIIKNQQIPKVPYFKLIDRFLSFGTDPNKKIFYDKDQEATDGLATDGFNNISLDRYKYYVKGNKYLGPNDGSKCTVPKYIFERFENMI